MSGREQLGQDILNLNRRQDAEQALGSRVMSDTARTDTLEQAARDTVIDAMVRQAQAGGQTQADKARAFDQVNAWLDENPEAKTLWDAERGAGRGNPAAQRAAQRIRAGMSEEEERAYEQAGELYDSYGSAWSAAHRLGSDVKGLAQQAAGSWATLAESIAPATRDEAANNSAERHALAELRRLTDEGKVFETDENGQIRTSDEYEAALARYNAAKEAGPQDNQKTVLTDENSAGMRLYHEGGENLAKAQAGLGSAARFGADTANAIAGNLPNMALALIPSVGPAVSLGALGAQAAGGRMAELYDEDTGADEALWRGLVSGGIEVGTEVLPVGSWVEIVNRGGKGLVRNLLQQMGEEGTEEAVGYVVNYLADVARQRPERRVQLGGACAECRDGGHQRRVLRCGGHRAEPCFEPRQHPNGGEPGRRREPSAAGEHPHGAGCAGGGADAGAGYAAGRRRPAGSRRAAGGGNPPRQHGGRGKVCPAGGPERAGERAKR